MERLNLRFCRTFLILLLGLFVSVGAFAQKISVTGVVKDQTGAPIIGGNIVVKGTTTGVITDVDGKFTLSANKGDVYWSSVMWASPARRSRLTGSR